MLYYLLFVICYLLIASCASSPKAGAVQKDGSPDYSLLPPGASIYLWADVEKAKPILKALSFAGLEGENSGKILDLTETAIGAFYGEGASRRFYLAGWGNYPNLRSGFAMTFNRDWKKIKSDTGNRYWYSQRNKLGVAVGPGMALASDGDPFAAGSPGSTAPQGYEEFRRGCVLSFWMNDSGPVIDSFLNSMGIPINIPAKDFFFGVVRIPADSSGSQEEEAKPWEIIFRIRTQSPSQARSLFTLITMARLFLGQISFTEASGNSRDMAALFFANPPVQEEECLVIRTGPLDERSIALLFNMFSLYSN